MTHYLSRWMNNKIQQMNRYAHQRLWSAWRSVQSDWSVHCVTIGIAIDSWHLDCGDFHQTGHAGYPGHQGWIQDFWKGGLYVDAWFLERGFVCGSRISGKGVRMYKGVGRARFANFISFFLNIPWKWNNLVTVRPNYFIFVGYFKTGGREGVQANPLNPLWISHWVMLMVLSYTSCWLISYTFHAASCGISDTFPYSDNIPIIHHSLYLNI